MIQPNAMGISVRSDAMAESPTRITLAQRAARGTLSAAASRQTGARGADRRLIERRLAVVAPARRSQRVRVDLAGSGRFAPADRGLSHRRQPTVAGIPPVGGRLNHLPDQVAVLTGSHGSDRDLGCGRRGVGRSGGLLDDRCRLPLRQV